MLRMFKGLLKDEKGSVIEYGLLVALMAVLGVGVAAGLFVQATGILENVPELFHEIKARPPVDPTW